MGHATSKLQRIEQMKRLCLENTYTPSELAVLLGCSRYVVHDYILEAPGMTNDGQGNYRYKPTKDDVNHALKILKAAGHKA